MKQVLTLLIFIFTTYLYSANLTWKLQSKEPLTFTDSKDYCSRLDYRLPTSIEVDYAFKNGSYIFDTQKDYWTSNTSNSDSIATSFRFGSFSTASTLTTVKKYASCIKNGSLIAENKRRVLLDGGWNLISAPGPLNASSLLKDEKTDFVYRYKNSNWQLCGQGNTSCFTSDAGEGFWLYTPKHRTQELVWTIDDNAQNSIKFNSGWHIVGLPTLVWKRDFNFNYKSIYTYVDDKWYDTQNIRALEPYRGYWINFDQDTVEVLNFQSVSNESVNLNFVENNELTEDELNTLTAIFEENLAASLQTNIALNSFYLLDANKNSQEFIKGRAQGAVDVLNAFKRVNTKNEAKVKAIEKSFNTRIARAKERGYFSDTVNMGSNMINSYLNIAMKLNRSVEKQFERTYEDLVYLQGRKNANEIFERLEDGSKVVAAASALTVGTLGAGIVAGAGGGSLLAAGGAEATVGSVLSTLGTGLTSTAFNAAGEFTVKGALTGVLSTTVGVMKITEPGVEFIAGRDSSSAKNYKNLLNSYYAKDILTGLDDAISFMSFTKLVNLNLSDIPDAIKNIKDTARRSEAVYNLWKTSLKVEAINKVNFITGKALDLLIDRKVSFGTGGVTTKTIENLPEGVSALMRDFQLELNNQVYSAKQLISKNIENVKTVGKEAWMLGLAYKDELDANANYEAMKSQLELKRVKQLMDTLSKMDTVESRELLKKLEISSTELTNILGQYLLDGNYLNGNYIGGLADEAKDGVKNGLLDPDNDFLLPDICESQNDEECFNKSSSSSSSSSNSSYSDNNSSSSSSSGSDNNSSSNSSNSGDSSSSNSSSSSDGDSSSTSQSDELNSTRNPRYGNIDYSELSFSAAPKSIYTGSCGKGKSKSYDNGRIDCGIDGYFNIILYQPRSDGGHEYSVISPDTSEYKSDMVERVFFSTTGDKKRETHEVNSYIVNEIDNSNDIVNIYKSSKEYINEKLSSQEMSLSNYSYYNSSYKKYFSAISDYKLQVFSPFTKRHEVYEYYLRKDATSEIPLKCTVSQESVSNYKSIKVERKISNNRCIEIYSKYSNAKDALSFPGEVTSERKYEIQTFGDEAKQCMVESYSATEPFVGKVKREHLKYYSKNFGENIYSVLISGSNFYNDLYTDYKFNLENYKLVNDRLQYCENIEDNLTCKSATKYYICK